MEAGNKTKSCLLITLLRLSVIFSKAGTGQQNPRTPYYNTLLVSEWMDQVSTIDICLFSSKEENGYYQNIGQQSFILNLWGPGVFQHLEFF